MRELGTMIDRVFDCLSPNRIAGLIGRRVGREAAGRKMAGLRNLLRALLAACEAVLILNMASCGNTYNGFELIRMTMRLEVSREYEWGALAVTFISAMSLAGLIVLAVKRAPFRTLCWMTALDMMFAVGAAGFYKINEMVTSSGLGVVHPLFGAYVAAVMYIVTFAAALAGRAYETAAGIGNERREYSHREGPYPTAALAVLIQVLLMLLMLRKGRAGSMEFRITLQVLLALDCLLLLLTACRSRYAGSAAVAEAIGIFYMGYVRAAKGWKLGVLFGLEYVTAFALAVWMMVWLNRRAEAGVQPVRTAAGAGRLPAPAAPKRPSAPAAPVRPSAPAAPVRPSVPAAPVRPSAPAAPVRPSTPAAPVRPSAPKTPVRPPASTSHPARFCTECGAKLDDDSRFCPGCGKMRD